MVIKGFQQTFLKKEEEEEEEEEEGKEKNKYTDDEKININYFMLIIK